MSHTRQFKEAEDGRSDASNHQEDADEGSLMLPQNIFISRVEPTSEVLVDRNARDVLCGRGVQVLHHAGNLHLHLAADEFREEYLGSRRDRKREIIETIVERLKATGSRFLKTAHLDKTKWVEADDTFAYQKVSHVLRGQNTGKAVKKIKKQESEVAKQKKEHEEAIQSAAKNQLSQVANFAMMPQRNLRFDPSMGSQAPLDYTSFEANAILQKHNILTSRSLASLRDANLGMQMLQQQSLQWTGHQNLLQSRLLAASATASQPNLANLLTQPNNSMFLPQRTTNRHHIHQQEQQRLMNIQQQQMNPSAFLQRLMQSNNSAASGIATSQEGQLKLQPAQSLRNPTASDVTSKNLDGSMDPDAKEA